MTKQPQISIIIPVYNVAEYIIECLQSVMRQTYQGAIECILVDDCGTDNSIAIAEKLIAEYNSTHSIIDSAHANNTSPLGGREASISFRILHHDHNRGLSAARNTGTAAATGDYIYYLDSDDYISDDCIEILTKPLQEKEYDMVLGNIKVFPTEQRFLWLDNEGEIRGNDKLFELFSTFTLYVMAWNKLCKRSFLQTHHITFLEEQLHEDELWTYKIMRVIESVYVLQEHTYFYRVRENSIMLDNKQATKRVESIFDTIQYVIEHPYSKNTELYNRYSISMIQKYIGRAMGCSLPIWEQYCYIRNNYKYNPLSEYISGSGTLQNIKHHLHWALPPALGYKYLQLRNWKNRK